MNEADEKVNRLILHMLHNERERGGKAMYGVHDYEAVPEHYVTCPDVTVVEAEVNAELWWDTGVEAVRLTARLSCPHEGEVDWEWADLGELPYLIEDMEAEEGRQ